MSFIDKISIEERSALRNVSNWEEYLEIAYEQFNESSEVNGQDGCFTIRNKIFEDTVILSRKFDCSIEFTNCYFLHSVVIEDLIVEKGFKINQCFCDHSIFFNGKQTKIGGAFDIIDISVRQQFYIRDGEYGYCRLGFKNYTNVFIDGGTFKELVIGTWTGSKINSLNLKLNAVSGLITITNPKTQINTLGILHNSADVSLVLEDFSINHIGINKFRNIKSFKILNIIPFNTEDSPSLFEIADSYLGKAEFYSVDFSSFEEVRILDTHLAECSFVNVKWPEIIDPFVNKYSNQKEGEKRLRNKLAAVAFTRKVTEKWKLEIDNDILEYHSNRREIFRQLKQAYSKQGDLINEQKFHELELLAYNKSLTWRRYFFTKLIINLSNYFGRFGQDVRSPLVGLLLGHLLFFGVLLLGGALSPLHFTIANSNSEGFWLAFNKYFNLINPLRKSDDQIFKGGWVLIDLLIRIWASYMIYNIIRASRRFIK